MSIPFDIHQLRCFIAVAEELHFGRAARRMNLTQPPLSRQIKLLETRLGVQLIERDNREVRLTAAGLAFLRGARQVILAAQTSTSLALEAANGSPVRLSIGFTPVAAYRVLPNLLGRFKKDFPSADLVLNELMTLPQLSALIRKDIDAALLRPSISLTQFERMLVCVDDLVAALPVSHHLAYKDTVELADFEGEPFIGHDPVRAKYLADITNHGFQEACITPRQIQALTEPQTMLAMVRAGLGLAIVAGQVGEYTKDPSVIFRPIKKGDLPPIETWLVWRRGNHSPAMRGLISSAKWLVKTQC